MLKENLPQNQEASNVFEKILLKMAPKCHSPRPTFIAAFPVVPAWENGVVGRSHGGWPCYFGTMRNIAAKSINRTTAVCALNGCLVVFIGWSLSHYAADVVHNAVDRAAPR